ncbi:MAG: potassium transporter TrkG [Eubacteriales bacterium]
MFKNDTDVGAYLRRYRLKKKMPVSQILVLGFFAVICIGTLLLMLPISTVARESASLETAAFTAVSATCITGLSVVDTITYWSAFGRAVILILIQIGGLGFMTFTVLFSMLLRRTITPRERLIITQSLGLSSDEGTVKLVRRILLGTLIIEGSGALVLSTQFIPLFGVGDGIVKSIFHSVSAFCNAGFDLMGSYSGPFSSLAAFRGNYVVNIVIMLLIITGGIGFLVWTDFVEFFTKRKRFSVYSKFVLVCTASLILIGALCTLCFEWSNPATLGELPIHEKLLASFFHSVTTRTAGFATVDNAAFTESTKIITILLMFTGGASASTAGGVKANTIGLLVYAVFATAAGKSDIVIFKRRVSHDNIMRALSVVSLTILISSAAAFGVMLSDNVPFISALYETVSAVATVGLSLSITPALGTVSHVLCMLLMFFGRVGILTITYSIMMRITSSKSAITYPDANMLVG